MKKISTILIILCSLFFLGTRSWADTQKTVVDVNGTKISLDEFNEIAQGRTDRENLLNQIIASILLAQEARRQGLDKDPSVQQQLKMINEQQLALFFYQKKVTDKTRLSDKELDNLIPAKERQKIRFQEIVTQSKEDAAAILSQIKQGTSFEKLAKEKSLGRNAKDGGDIGFVIINTNIFPEEVEEVIFKLKDGEVSEPIKTREGYALFKAIERKNLTDKELESKKNYLQFKLAKEKTDQITSSLLESLRSKANVKVLDKNLAKIEEAKVKDDSLLKIQLAEVNGNAITLNDIIGGQATYGNPLDSPLLKNPSFLKNMVEDKIKNVLFVTEAKRIGMEKDPEFQRKTKIFADGVLANKFAMDILCKDIKASDDEYRKFYDEHKNDPQFKNIPERVRVKHILVDDAKLADDIMKRLKKGENFAALAKQHSIDQFSAEKGGDLGFIQRGRMDHAFEEAAFGTKVGDVKQIERNNFGAAGGGQGKIYDIISVTDRKSAGANKFEDVKDIIEPTLLYKKREQKITDYIEQLKTKATITKNMKLVNTAPTAGSMPPAAPPIP
ncbi:MAG: peptidylprolyl isomerase [bacterium]